jgi:hypothetical protein
VRDKKGFIRQNSKKYHCNWSWFSKRRNFKKHSDDIDAGYYLIHSMASSKDNWWIRKHLSH